MAGVRHPQALSSVSMGHCVVRPVPPWPSAPTAGADQSVLHLQSNEFITAEEVNFVIKRAALIFTLVFVVGPFPAVSQDTRRTIYRSDYSGPCSSSIRFTETPPARYWCRVPNGRAIRIPMEPVNVEVLTTVSVCTLETLTRRDDAAPCGFPGGVLLWEGKPRGDIEISHAGSSFGDPLTEPGRNIRSRAIGVGGRLPRRWQFLHP